LVKGLSPLPAGLLGFPWLEILGPLLGSPGIAGAESDTLYVTSDWSERHIVGDYWVLSVLLAQLFDCSAWEVGRGRVRQTYLGDGRRLSFKRLGDKARRDALMPFLEAAGTIAGHSISVIVSKRIIGLFRGGQGTAAVAARIGLLARWKPAQLTALFRMASFVAYFVAHYVRPGQHVYWIADNDPVFADRWRHADVARLMSVLADAWVCCPVGELGVGTTSLDEGDRAEEDLCAIPDLLAGALSEAAARTVEAHLFDGMVPEGCTEKTERILSWCQGPKRLVTKVFLLDRKDDHTLYVVPLLGAEHS
jgi:hypothetical protein